MAEETHAEIDPRMTASIPWIMRNGVGIQIMETLAVGAFLTAFAVQLGASNFTIGLLAATEYNLEGLRNGEHTESNAGAKKHDTELID